MRDLKVEASWPPGACCCGGGASKETRLRKRCWARSPGDAKAMSGGRLITSLACSWWQLRWAARGVRLPRRARQALSESRRMRDGAQPSSCPVPYGGDCQPIVTSCGVRRRGLSRPSGGLGDRYQEAITFGDHYFRLGRKKCHRGAATRRHSWRHALILKHKLHNSPQPRRPPPARRRRRHERRQRIVGVEASAGRLLLRR